MLPAGQVLTHTAVGVVLVAAAVVALVLLLLYVGYRQRTGVMAYAEAQGWGYRAHDGSLARRYTGHPFVSDAGAHAEAVITGDFAGIPFAAYAYTYQFSSTDASGRESSMTQTIPVVSLLLQSGLPDLDVVPTAARDGTWSDRSPYDVVTQSAEFDAIFHVRTADIGFATSVLHPRLTHDLMAYPERGWSVRAGDVVSMGSWNGKPEKIPSYLDHLGMIVHSIPEPVWQSYGGRPGSRLAGADGDDPDQPNSSSR